MTTTPITYALDTLMYLLACQIATYQHARSLKKTAKSQIARHRNIIKKGLLGLILFDKFDDGEQIIQLGNLARFLRHHNVADLIARLEKQQGEPTLLAQILTEAFPGANIALKEVIGAKRVKHAVLVRGMRKALYDARETGSLQEASNDPLRSGDGAAEAALAEDDTTGS